MTGAVDVQLALSALGLWVAAFTLLLWVSQRTGAFDRRNRFDAQHARAGHHASGRRARSGPMYRTTGISAGRVVDTQPVDRIAVRQAAEAGLRIL